MRTFILGLLSAYYFIHMNSYFGWNRTPQSPEELLADSVVFIMLGITILSVQRR